MKELIAIQQELNVPKNQRNSFGNYNYIHTQLFLQPKQTTWVFRTHQKHQSMLQLFLIHYDKVVVFDF